MILAVVFSLSFLIVFYREDPFYYDLPWRGFILSFYHRIQSIIDFTYLEVIHYEKKTILKFNTRVIILLSTPTSKTYLTTMAPDHS